jgi:hypothetical protein
MGNRKGISSEELFGNQYEKSEEIKEKYSQLNGAKAISSDMFFGRAQSEKNLGEEFEGHMMGRHSLNSKQI